MIRARSFVEAAGEHGFRFYTGVPCSYLTPFIDFVLASGDLRYVNAANEGDALAIGSGAELAGRRSVVMFQNSGLGNAINPLTSLSWTFRIPVLLVPTWRAEPGGDPDEPQHELMGRITTRLLELCDVPWEPFPDDEAQIPAALERALAHMQRERRPYALVMRKGSVAREADAPPAPASPARAVALAADRPPEPRVRRRAMLAALQRAVASTGGRDLVVATTGYTGRELYALDDRPNQIYMVGSMGCAPALGLGLALARPERRTIVVDGDGAALMRLGVQAAIGCERPPNLVHVLLDNRVHESTGGQATLSSAVDFRAVALGLGYARAERTADPAGLAELLADDTDGGPLLVHAPILPGVEGELVRPRLRPDEVAARLRAFLGEGSR